MLKQDFDRDGYVAIRGFLDDQEMTELTRQTDDFVARSAPDLPAEIAYFEDKNDASTLKQVQKLYDYDPYFEKLANSDKVRGLAEELFADLLEADLSDVDLSDAMLDPVWRERLEAD